MFLSSTYFSSAELGSKYNSNICRLRKRFSDFLEFSHLMKKKYGRETPMLPIHRENELTPSNVGYFADFLLIFLRKTVEIGLGDEEVRNFL